jgi:hypothetical protein
MSLDGCTHIRHPSTVALSRAHHLDLDHVTVSANIKPRPCIISPHLLVDSVLREREAVTV